MSAPQITEGVYAVIKIIFSLLSDHWGGKKGSFCTKVKKVQRNVFWFAFCETSAARDAALSDGVAASMERLDIMAELI